MVVAVIDQLEIVEDVLSTLKDDRHFFLRKGAEEFLTEE